jgi:hypothetical protein
MCRTRARSAITIAYLVGRSRVRGRCFIGVAQVREIDAVAPPGDAEARNITPHASYAWVAVTRLKISDQQLEGTTGPGRRRDQRSSRRTPAAVSGNDLAVALSRRSQSKSVTAIAACSRPATHHRDSLTSQPSATLGLVTATQTLGPGRGPVVLPGLSFGFAALAAASR